MIGAAEWAAIGACATAIVTVVSALLLHRSVKIQQKSFALQEQIYAGQLLLSLERNGKYIAVVLQNTGNNELLDVRIRTVPALEVPSSMPKSCLDVSRTWLIPNVGLKRILPHQTLRDDEAFCIDDFVAHFQRDFVIEATLSYMQNGVPITSKQIIDTSVLSRIQHETSMREHYRK